MLTRQITGIRSAVALAALNFALMTPQFAQSADSPAGNAAETEELGEVVITGSRLATGFDMPTPVAVYNADELAVASPNNMAEALGQLPSLGGSVQASTSGQGSGNSGSNGQSLLNLRQLGTSRTLVLLDGQRMGVTNVGNSVDIGIIPQNLVKRVDIVTGGASASYGSDAVAGAVNFVLDTGFQGLKTEFTGGITTYRDNKNGKFSVAYGKSFGDRGRMVAAAEYFKMGGMNYGEETGRYWFDHPTGAWANPTAGARPTTVLVPDSKSEFGTYGGTITAVAACPAAGTPTGDACRSLANKQFVAGGALAPYNFGVLHAVFAGGGDGAIVNQPFTPDTLRRSLFLHGEYDINPGLTLWAQGSYNSNVTFLNSQVVSQLTNLQFTIFEGNAYLPAAVSSALANAAGNQSFSLSRYDMDMGVQQDYSNVIVRRLSVGAKGRINDRWTFDTTLTQQNTAQILDIKVSDQRRLYAAADAVTNPATGQVVCRSSFFNTAGVFVPGGTGLDPGCVPVNLYGPGAVSQAAADYIMGVNTADVRLKQTTFDMNVRGDFGETIALPAGPISFASGMNYRRTTANRTVDALSNIYLDGTGLRGFPTGLQNRYGGYQFYNPSPLSGRVSVSEGYVEFGVPLLKDVPLFKSLATTLAGRLSDYSQSGVEDMWKLGLNWTVNGSLRVRGTVSADTRAPSVLELFNTATVTRGSNRFPSSSSPVQIQSAGQNIAIGNQSLTPEHARTYTAGIVLSPGFIPSFQASVDWYKIKITDQISSPGNQTVIDRCYAGDQSYCKLILVNGQPITTTAGITTADFPTVTNPTLNQPAQVSTSGLDFAAAYVHEVGSGKLGLRLAANDLLAIEDKGNGCPVGALGPVSNYVGSIGNGCGNYPKITGRIGANYDIGRFGMGVTERYIDKGKINPTFVPGVDITFNDVPAIWYTDLNLTYGLGNLFGGDGTAFLNVTNAFNKDPPVTTSSSRSWIVPTEFTLYDVQGRRYVMGARFKW